MDIYDFIRAEDERLLKLMGKLKDPATPAEVRTMLIHQARIQFGALTRVEGEHFYPALEMYDETKASAAMHRDMVRGISTALDALESADLANPDNLALLEGLPAKVEAFVKSKEEALFSVVRNVIPEDLALGLGLAAEQDINTHRRKLAGAG
jgi:hypothetical protein